MLLDALLLQHLTPNVRCGMEVVLEAHRELTSSAGEVASDHEAARPLGVDGGDVHQGLLHARASEAKGALHQVMSRHCRL